MSGRARLVVVIALLLGVVALRLPALTARYAIDDEAQVAMVDGSYPVARGPLELYTFARGDPGELAALQQAGNLPWWSEPGLTLAATRPLASALRYVELRALGPAPRSEHLHSLAWWIALLGAAWWLLRAVLPRPAAGLAWLVYALDECHALPLAWIANRNALIAGALALTAVGAYVRARERGSSRLALVSLVAFQLSLWSSELALGAVGFVIAWELLCGARAGARRTSPRLAGLVVALAGLHVAAIAASGRGAAGSAVYVDPTRAPAAFLEVASGRLHALLGGLVLGDGSIAPALAWAALALLALVLVTLRERGSLALLVGGVLALAPALAAPPHPRLVVLPALGLAAAVGAVMMSAARRLAEAVPWLRHLPLRSQPGRSIDPGLAAREAAARPASRGEAAISGAQARRSVDASSRAASGAVESDASLSAASAVESEASSRGEAATSGAQARRSIAASSHAAGAPMSDASAPASALMSDAPSPAVSWLRHLWAAALALLALGLVAAHLVRAPIAARRELTAFAARTRAVEEAARSLDFGPQTRVVLLTAGDLDALLYAHRVAHRRGAPLPAAWWPLTLGTGTHALTRIAADAFELELPGLLLDPRARLFRAADLAVGDRVALSGVAIEVLEVSPLGPTRLRVQLDASLDDASIALAVTSRAGLHQFPAPPIGRRVTLPRPASLGGE
ncbi:MAG: hypothetical protein KC636_19315 [Myxococcales bacterium]|nr:hypothetical protein [Myxococcales bacterium]